VSKLLILCRRTVTKDCYQQKNHYYFDILDCAITDQQQIGLRLYL